MQGPCLTQARLAIEACLGALSTEDVFGLVAFDDEVGSLGQQLLDGSRQSRDMARQFLQSIEAGGGTELAAGFLAAAKLLGAEGGDVLVLTDGQVSETKVILAKARQAGIRIHCLGIGSASQDRFLALLARETGGECRFVTPRERVDLAALDLFASISQPVASRLKAGTANKAAVDLAPDCPERVYPGSPVVLFGRTNRKSATNLRLTWQGSDGQRKLELPVRLAASPDAGTVGLLQGARLITDLEARLGSVSARGREATRQRKALEKLSAKYGLASQAMSLVAIVKRKGDKAGKVPATRIVPVGMPQDTSFETYFAGASTGATFAYAPPAASVALRRARPAPSILACRAVLESRPPDVDMLMLELATRIDPDGGIQAGPGMDRWVVTAAAAIYLVARGYAAKTGLLRQHMARVLAFLKTAPGKPATVRAEKLLECLEAGTALPGDWTKWAESALASQIDPDEFWKEVEKALAMLAVA